MKGELDAEAKGFTKEFEAESIRLAQMSGRMRREVVENLGIGLSTLTRWLARSRDRRLHYIH